MTHQTPSKIKMIHTKVIRQSYLSYPPAIELPMRLFSGKTGKEDCAIPFVNTSLCMNSCA